MQHRFIREAPIDPPEEIASRRMSVAFLVALLGFGAIWWEFYRDGILAIMLIVLMVAARACAEVVCRWTSDLAPWLMGIVIAIPCLVFALLQVTHGHLIVSVHPH